ncbi:MAG: cyclase [Acidobacteria bacterium]|nr:MAG: cyclase [Acidobacteriota bacterium]
MTSDINVAGVERWASALGGAALAAYGIRQLKDRSPSGAALTAAGTALIYRGATGHCPMYSAAGINTADSRDDTRTALSGARGVNVQETVTISRPADELYRFWRSFELLPSFMHHLVSVEQLDQCRSHWVAKAPAGRTIEWNAEIINEIPGELIGWRTLDGSEVVSAGSVRFKPAPGGRGTEVRVRLQYDPPGGKLGSTIAWMFGEEPSQTIREDLRRFKRLMETGEIPTTDGQPRGNR